MEVLEYKRSSPSLTFDQGFSYFDGFKHLIKTKGPIVFKFHIEPSEIGRMKNCSIVQNRMMTGSKFI